MATLAAEARSTLGVYNFCKAEVMKGKMTQHLKFCKERRKDNAARDADSTKQKTKLFSLLIWEGEEWDEEDDDDEEE